MNLLLVEDDKAKATHIKALLSDVFPQAKINLSYSVVSALKQLSEYVFDLILLDMSLPTYDISSLESGGQPRGFGGKEVMDYMERRDISTPVIVITQFDDFVQNDKVIGIYELEKSLKNEYTELFIGIIKYNTVVDSWKPELINALNLIKQPTDGPK